MTSDPAYRLRLEYAEFISTGGTPEEFAACIRMNISVKDYTSYRLRLIEQLNGGINEYLYRHPEKRPSNDTRDVVGKIVSPLALS